MHPDDAGLHSEGHQGLPPDAGFRPNDREKLHKGRLCNHAQPLFVLFISWGGGGVEVGWDWIGIGALAVVDTANVTRTRTPTRTLQNNRHNTMTSRGNTTS